MKKLLAGFVVVLFTAPLVVSAQTTRPADRPAGDTKAPAWKNTAALHETKDIIGTVIGLGGLAGVGEKKVVVPWSELKFAPTAEGKKNAVVMDQAKLESAPRYERRAGVERSPSASPSTMSPTPYNPNKQ